jgi:hypothetical protein
MKAAAIISFNVSRDSCQRNLIGDLFDTRVGDEEKFELI